MINPKRFVIGLSLIAFVLSATAFSQSKPKAAKRAAKARNIIFAVTNDGRSIEPITIIENRKPVPSTSDENAEEDRAAFTKEFYRPKTSYTIIFGGAPDGTLTVKAADTGECAGNSATVSSAPTTAKLKGFVMALATNIKRTDNAEAMRRRPTAAEREEVEKLVRAELLKQTPGVTSIESLRYHNLTAIDVDHDGVAELVGSYWFAPRSNERNVLFFIAEKNDSGNYVIAHGEFKAFKPDDVMSGDPKDMDDGIYHELLLDYFDYDGDGVAEIFTTTQAFEGRNFQIYRKADGKWTKAYDSYNYRCGY